MIETDILATADGKIIAFHDNDLNRLCAKNSLAKETNYSDFRLSP
jgi:glycerophosphoryl diester phosphodiesterase